MSDAVKAALREAAGRFCICDGECYEMRHGMMNGPCEAMIGQAAAAIAAFLRALPTMHFRITPGHVAILGQRGLEELAAAVARAAQEDKR
jgi:hypothetical protein